MQRPWLGAQLQEVTPDIADGLRHRSPGGRADHRRRRGRSGGARAPQGERPDRVGRRPSTSPTSHRSATGWRRPAIGADRRRRVHPRRQALQDGAGARGGAGDRAARPARRSPAIRRSPARRSSICRRRWRRSCRSPASRRRHRQRRGAGSIAASHRPPGRTTSCVDVNGTDDRYHARRSNRSPAARRARGTLKVAARQIHSIERRFRRLRRSRWRRSSRRQDWRRPAATAAGRPAAAGAPGRRRRSGPSARAGRRADPHARVGVARLADLLGAAGHRQDDRRAAAGRGDRPPFRADFGDLLRRRRSQEGVRGGPRRGGRPAVGTLLFVDEIHRFNRAQQDSFLPVMEDGTVTLVGATTENPSFELNAALLSRARVLVFKPLDDGGARAARSRAPRSSRARQLPLDDEARADAGAHGRRRRPRGADAGRGGLARGAPGRDLRSRRRFRSVVQRRAPVYDKGQDGHYNLISALHKAVRGSDPDAALYYLARMLDAGEQPLYIGRRLVRMAMEDIGLADPQALVVALAAKDAYDYLGSPEGELALAEAAVYLATAPKSNAVYSAFGHAMRAAKEGGSLPPPKHHPQCADQADEERGLRLRIPLRPRRARRLFRPELFSRGDSAGAATTTRRSAASSARSGSGSTTGPSFARSGGQNDLFLLRRQHEPRRDRAPVPRVQDGWRRAAHRPSPVFPALRPRAPGRDRGA